MGSDALQPHVGASAITSAVSWSRDLSKWTSKVHTRERANKNKKTKRTQRKNDEAKHNNKRVTQQAGKRGGHTKVALVFMEEDFFRRFVRSWEQKKKNNNKNKTKTKQKTSSAGTLRGSVRGPRGVPRMGELAASVQHTPGRVG